LNTATTNTITITIIPIQPLQSADQSTVPTIMADKQVVEHGDELQRELSVIASIPQSECT